MALNVIKDFGAGYLSADALNDILAKTVADLTIDDVNTLLDALRRVPDAPGLDSTLTDLLQDQTVPSVVGVAISGDTEGVFRTDDVLTITVTMTDPVQVSGFPFIAVVIDGSTVDAAYASGSTTDTLIFAYTISDSDITDTTGEVSIAHDALDLNSGSIKDYPLDDNDADMDLGTIDTTAFVVNGVVPVVASAVITGDTAGAFVTDDVFTITITWNVAVAVIGTPEIALQINTDTRQVVYASGTGTDTTIFTYTITAEDTATAGQVHVQPDAFNANGGSIKDAALDLNDAVVNLGAITDTGSMTVN